jgi:hypothetical protein
MAEQPHSAGGVSVDPALQIVIAAENALALTWQRLNTLRRQAFYGGRYDSAEYDKAVAEYRVAERALREARSGWQRGPGPLRATPAALAGTADTADTAGDYEAKAA